MRIKSGTDWQNQSRTVSYGQSLEVETDGAGNGSGRNIVCAAER